MARSGGISQELRVDGQKEVVAAFNEIGAAGEQNFAKIDRGSKTAAQSLKGFTRETVGMRKASNQLFRQFGSLGSSLENIGALLGSFGGGILGGVVGFAAGRAIGSVVEQLGQVDERLRKIRDTAREMGQKPLVVQAFQNIAQQAGEGADAGAKILGGISDLIQKEATQTKRQTTFDGVKELRGSTAAAGEAAQTAAGHFQVFNGVIDQTVKTFKGGVPVMTDFSDPLKTIGVDLSKFKDSADASQQKTKAIIQGFLNWAKSMDPTSQKLNEMSKILFRGLPAEAALNILPGKLKEIEAEIERLSKSAAGATPVKLDLVAELDKSKGRLDQTLAEMKAPMDAFFLKLAIDMNNAMNTFLTVTLPGWQAGIQVWATNFLPKFSADFTAGWQTMLDNFRRNGMASLADSLTDWGSFFNSVKGIAQSTLDWIAQKIQQVADAIRSTLASFPGDPGGMPAMPTGDVGGDFGGGGEFAAGGMVRGPGSATSDSIMARLSNGEFVMRASAVRHWGAGLLASMNAAAGGLSLPLLPRRPGRFAEGGLVMAGDGAGRPVHLHLGNKSFVLAGSESVVESLVTEAHRHRMRSAGVKPSWYGGTPGR